MNRATRRRIAMSARARTLAETWGHCIIEAGQFGGPLSDAELEISNRLLNMTKPCAWYHGGARGLSVGDHLRPASATGADPRKVGGSLPNRMRSVFFSAEIETARWFADRVPGGGSVYEVKPIGNVEADSIHVRAIVLFQAYCPRCMENPAFIDALPKLSFSGREALIIGTVSAGRDRC